MLSRPVESGMQLLGFCFLLVCFAIYLRLHSLSEFAWMSTPGKIGHCLEYFPLLNNLPQCTMMDFKLFGNNLITLPRLMGATIASLQSLLMCFLIGIVLTHG